MNTAMEEVQGPQKKLTFISRLIENSESDTYEEALKEWSFVYLGHSDLEQGYRCLCTKPIANLYHMYNETNGNEIIIGCECVQKFGSDDWKEKTRTATNESKRTTRDCGECGRRYKKGSDCDFCNRNVRCIGTCGDWIPKDPKKPRCLNCWKDYMKTVEMKVCERCTKPFKPLYKYCVLCIDCYKKLKGF